VSNLKPQRTKAVEAQGGRCYYCNWIMPPGDATTDHVVALSRGGKFYRRSNIVAACRACNKFKADLSVNEFLKSHKYAAILQARGLFCFVRKKRRTGA
jgi:5-methylcytosine-specific restriction endonuclease McrA